MLLAVAAHHAFHGKDLLHDHFLLVLRLWGRLRIIFLRRDGRSGE